MVCVVLSRVEGEWGFNSNEMTIFTAFPSPSLNRNQKLTLLNFSETSSTP